MTRRKELKGNFLLTLAGSSFGLLMWMFVPLGVAVVSGVALILLLHTIVHAVDCSDEFRLYQHRPQWFTSDVVTALGVTHVSTLGGWFLVWLGCNSAGLHAFNGQYIFLGLALIAVGWRR